MPTLRSITDLQGPAGRIEALLNSGSPTAPFSVLLCHPHPPSGGSMHNKVVYHAMKAFNSLDLPVLRINFRGVGLSEGTYDRGPGECEDALAALAWLHRNLGLPILAAGFSFGAAVALEAASLAQPPIHIAALVGLGLPVSIPQKEGPPRQYHYRYLAHAPQPKLFLIGDHDRFAPHAEVETIAASSQPVTLHWVPDSDHFFNAHPDPSAPSHLAAMQQALRLWLQSTFPTLQP